MKLLNKVPEVTLTFWIIKILATTVGETGADFLNFNLHLGLTTTSYIMFFLLLVALFIQFKTKRYTPIVYWLVVFFISIVGTLITDNMTDAMGIPLELSTIMFSILLAFTFFIWYKVEKTLSVHSIDTFRREIFYWLVILFTFALGTASGDLFSEKINLGYLLSGIIFSFGILLIFILYKYFNLNSVLAFWCAYILTRPLGASFGDYLSQSTINGGLGFGTISTSFIFTALIIILVIYLSNKEKNENISNGR